MESNALERKYLVRIEERNNYLNARPVGEFVDDGFYELSQEQILRFGKYGTITIVRRNSGFDSVVLEDEMYCVLSISDDEIDDLETTSSGHRIRIQDFLNHCALIDNTMLREVILVQPEHFDSWGKNQPLNVMLPITKEVYFYNKASVFGPFTWEKAKDLEDQYVFSPKDDYYINVYNKQEFSDSIYYSFSAAAVNYDRYYGFDRYIILLNQLPKIEKKVDSIDDQNLKELLIKIFNQDNGNRNDKEKLKEMVLSLPQEELSGDRKKRFEKLINNGFMADDVAGLLPKMFTSNNDYLEEVLNAAEKNANYRNELLKFLKKSKDYDSIIQSIESELANKHNELKSLQDEIDKLEPKKANIAEIDSKELELLKNENLVLKDKVVAMKGHLNSITGELGNLEQLQEKKSNLEEEIRQKETQITAIGGVNATIEHQIEEKIKNAYTSMSIDPILSSLMLKAATDFQREATKRELYQKVALIGNIKNKSTIGDAKDLVVFLHEELNNKAHRKFSVDDIANMLICISQGFLTVFAGAPGTGKTSLVSIMAKVLGLSNDKNSRYAEIAVEKGWTSRRDLIGYYNPLTKSIIASERDLFDALAILNEENLRAVEDFPYWVLLDEANLSPMEHYWADFMNACDLKKSGRQVVLADDYVFKLPKTLRFLATINLDHTTEILSPRLIDRAWIIKLEPQSIDIENYQFDSLDLEYPMVQNSVFKQISEVEGIIDSDVASEFNAIHDLCSNYGMSFSPRIIGMIRDFCIAGQKLMNTEKNHYVALDYAVAEKVLPMIDGYGDMYKAFLEELLKACDISKMPKCHLILESIIKKGNANMQYYKFFAR